MKKSVITLLIFLIMIISVSAVSAADDASDLGATDDDALSISNTDVAIADGVKNFTDLNNDIAAVGDIHLGSNYVRNDTTEPEVTINTDKIIDGHGYTIDANGTGKIFAIKAGTVTLKNVILKNTGNYAIGNAGTLTLENVTFINCSSYSIASTGDLTVKNCIFEDYGINFQGTTLSLSGNTFNNASAPFVILKSGSTLASESTVTVVANCNPWDKVNVVATVKDDKGNLVAVRGSSWTVKIGDDTYNNVGTTDGILNTSKDAQKYGLQEVTATFAGLTNPTIVASSVDVKPTKQDATVIEYKLSNTTAIAYGDSFNITVNITNLVKVGTNQIPYNATSTFTIFVNTEEGETVDINATTGKAIFEFNNIARNNYAIKIKYNGDDVYPASEVEIPEFTVGAKDVTPVITVTLLEDGTHDINIIFPTDAIGTVTANVTDNLKYNITSAPLSEGKVHINTDLAAGDYKLNVAFVPSDTNYNKYNGVDLPFTIDRLNTTVEISVQNTTYGNNATITFTLASGVHNATYIIKDSKDNVAYEGTVNLTNGAYTLELDVPAADEYTITVASADPKYIKANNNTKFNVAQATSAVTMVIGDHILGNPVQANVTVKFGNKNGTGTVSLVVNGHDVTGVALNENGTATLNIDKDYIKAGENKISAVFNSTNSNYTNVTITDTFTVNQVTPTITVAVGDVNITKVAELTITVAGDAGTPTGFVTVKLGDKEYPMVGLTAGVATVTIPAADINEVKEYSVEVTYDPNGNVNYTANSTVFKFNVTYWNYVITIDEPITNVTVAENITFKVSAKGDKAFSNNFTVAIIDANGNVVNKTSVALNNNGDQVTVQFKLPQGVYTAAVAYPGDIFYDADNVVSKEFSVVGIIENLTIEVENATYPNNATATVKASVDGLYNVTVEGKSYNVTVSGGIGSVYLDVLAAKDSYTATVASMMADYNKTTNTTTFTVKKGKAQATFTITDVNYPDLAKVVVESDVDGTYYIRSLSGLTPKDTEVIVVNGTGNKTLGKIDVGTYTFALVGVSGNENYTANVQIGETKQLTVSKGTADVNLTVEDVFYNNTAEAVINVTVGGDYNITLINATGAVIGSVVENFNDGDVKTYTAPVLTPGTYTVNVTATITNYNPVEITKTFEVKNGVIIYNVTVADYTYNDTGKQIAFETSLPGKVDGYAIYLLAGDENIKNFTTKTSGNFDLPKLAAGTYTVKVVPFKNDTAFEYYDYAESNSTTFKVNPKEAEFTIEVLSVTYPANVTVKVKNSNFDGNYTVKVGDITKEFNVTGGAGEVNITDLPVGGYIAYVTSNNANYTVVTKTATFSVNYGPITPKVADITVAYLEKPVVVVESTAAGVYTVTVNGKDYTVNVADGKGNVTIDGELYVGTYDVKLTADIPDYVPYVNDTIAKITVNKANVGLSIVVDNVTYPDVTTATVFANVSGIYSIKVGDVVIANATIDTTPGVMANTTVDLKAYTPATTAYAASVNATEINGNFTVTEATTTFNVNKATPEIIIEVSESYEIYDNITVYVTVSNAVGINEFKITCTALNVVDTIIINGTSGNYTIPANKVNVFGTQVITVSYDKDNGNFTKGAKNQTAFEVTKITPVFNITDNAPIFNEDAIVNITFLNLKEGANITGSITIADVGSAAVDGDKNYTFELGKLAAGVHNLNITFSGNGLYNGISEIYPLTVSKFTPVVNVTKVTGGVYPDNATVTFTSDVAGDFIITVIDAEGTVVKTIEGINATANTAKTVNIEGLNAGKYTANVTYVESENYTSVTNTSDVFQIAKAVTTINATALPVAYPNVATVVVNAGKAGTCTIKVAKGGILYYNTTADLAAGENTIALTALPAGDYTFTVAYDSDDYVADPATGNLTVAKGTPTITIEGSATYPEAASVTVTSNADGGYAIYTLTGIIKEGNFTAGEPVVVDLGVLGAGTHDIGVVYYGNANYDATTVVGNVTVAQGTPVITLTVNTQTIGEDATLTISIPYATGDSVSVNTNISVPLVNGVGTYNIGVLEATDYTFTAVYDGDANLTFGQNTIAFTVAKLPSNLVVKANNITLGEVANVIVTIDNKATLAVGIYVDGVYVASAEVTNGAAIIPVADIAGGDHNITVVYGGSAIYSEDAQTVAINVHVPVYVISENKNIAVVYSGTATYKVLVTKDGVPAAGETVTIVFNGASKAVTTDENGYATYTFKTTKVAPKSYTITATCQDAKVKNTVKVTHVLKVANKAVKKSSKVTKVKVALKQVDGKYLAKKTIKIKFRGTTYKVTTNAKGIGYWKVTKAMVSKLKVGSKYTYKATYGKDAVSKKLVIKA